MEILNTSFLKPIFEGCNSFGINTQKLLLQSDLKYFNCADPTAFVPMNAANEFLSLLCNKEGINDISDEFSESIQISALQDFSALLDNSYSLLDACLIAEQMSNCILSNEVLRLSFLGNKVIFSQFFSNLSAAEYEQVVQINLIYLLNGFKAIAPDGWAPKEVHYQLSFLPHSIEKLISASKTKVFINQPSSAVVFETDELLTSQEGIQPSFSGLSTSNRNTFLYKVEAILSSYQVGYITPSIAQISNMIGMNERTFRRRLKAENLTFEGVFSSWRVRKAIALLKNETITIEDVSQQLHYANAKNFARAFKKTFQVSPSQYRDLLAR